MRIILEMELEASSLSAQDLYLSGILQNQSYLAYTNFDILFKGVPEEALINRLFEDLRDPITYDHFKDYSRIKSNIIYRVLNSMG